MGKDVDCTCLGKGRRCIKERATPIPPVFTGHFVQFLWSAEIGTEVDSHDRVDYVQKKGLLLIQLVNTTGCFANSWFEPVPVYKIHLLLPGIYGTAKH